MRLAGTRDQLIAILAPTYAASPQSGQGEPTFTEIGSVWATVRALSGVERLSAGSISAQITYELETDYWPEVTPAYQVAWTPFRAEVPVVLQIHGVRPGAHDSMILDCGVVE